MHSFLLFPKISKSANCMNFKFLPGYITYEHIKREIKNYHVRENEKWCHQSNLFVKDTYWWKYQVLKPYIISMLRTLEIRKVPFWIKKFWRDVNSGLAIIMSTFSCGETIFWKVWNQKMFNKILYLRAKISRAGWKWLSSNWSLTNFYVVIFLHCLYKTESMLFIRHQNCFCYEKYLLSEAHSEHSQTIKLELAFWKNS